MVDVKAFRRFPALSVIASYIREVRSAEIVFSHGVWSIRPVRPTIGLRQGCSVSPVVFRWVLSGLHDSWAERISAGRTAPRGTRTPTLVLPRSALARRVVATHAPDCQHASGWPGQTTAQRPQISRPKEVGRAHPSDGVHTGRCSVAGLCSGPRHMARAQAHFNSDECRDDAWQGSRRFPLALWNQLELMGARFSRSCLHSCMHRPY